MDGGETGSHGGVTGATCCTVYVSKLDVCERSTDPSPKIIRGQQHVRETWLVAQFKRAVIPSIDGSTWNCFTRLKTRDRRPYGRH